MKINKCVSTKPLNHAQAKKNIIKNHPYLSSMVSFAIELFGLTLFMFSAFFLLATVYLSNV